MQYNRFQVAGYLSAKPEIRILPSGTKVANARLGQSYSYEQKDGQEKSHANWFSLSFYERLAEIALMFDKGDNLHVEGTIEQREFTPQDGSKRTIYEIVVRSCHRIAPLRAPGDPTQQPSEREPNETPHHAINGGLPHDPTWPVG